MGQSSGTEQWGEGEGDAAAAAGGASIGAVSARPRPNFFWTWGENGGNGGGGRDRDREGGGEDGSPVLSIRIRILRLVASSSTLPRVILSVRLLLLYDVVKSRMHPVHTHHHVRAQGGEGGVSEATHS